MILGKKHPGLVAAFAQEIDSSSRLCMDHIGIKLWQFIGRILNHLG